VAPTAAARGRPDLAAADGIAALERVAEGLGVELRAEAVRVTDDAAAGDTELAARLASSDLIHLPGGDPDLIPRLYPGSAAWAAMTAAVDGGAVLAGASAGAMALAERTWTPAGLVPGLGLVPGVIVMPHADAGAWARTVARFAALDIGRLGVLGLAERTGIIGRPGGPWRVIGEGEVRWLAPGLREADAAVVGTPGTSLELR
jgi:cyanophycinase